MIFIVWSFVSIISIDNFDRCYIWFLLASTFYFLLALIVLLAIVFGFLLALVYNFLIISVFCFLFIFFSILNYSTGSIDNSKDLQDYLIGFELLKPFYLYRTS